MGYMNDMCLWNIFMCIIWFFYSILKKNVYKILIFVLKKVLEPLQAQYYRPILKVRASLKCVKSA